MKETNQITNFHSVASYSGDALIGRSVWLPAVHSFSGMDLAPVSFSLSTDRSFSLLSGSFLRIFSYQTHSFYKKVFRFLFA